MKKLVLFFLILLASFSFADYGDPCTNIWPLNIISPLNDFTLNADSTFTFEAEVWSPDVITIPAICTTNLTFQYNQGLNPFIRIKDPVFDPGINALSSEDSTLQSVDFINFAHVTVPITVKCNIAGDYQLRLYATAIGDGNTSSSITIHCLSNNTPPTGNFVKPSSPSFVYGDSYRVEWESFDSEDDPLTYEIEWDGPTTGSDTGLTEKYYDLTSLSLGDYTFNVTINDGINAGVVISSSTLTVKESLNTLSVSGLTITPQVIYGNEAIDVNLTLRNNSSNEVDINVLFFNDGFVSNPGISYVQYIQPYSKADFSVHEDFSSNNLTAGDYNVRIYSEEFFAGTSNPTGNTLTSFANFTVLAEKKSVALPETNLVFVLLISLTVLIITKKK